MKKIILLILILFVIISCSKSEKKLNTLEHLEIIKFKNDSLTTLLSGCFINYNEFLLLNQKPKAIFKYNTKGVLIKSIYLKDLFYNNNSFNILRADGDCLYLWDEDRLELFSIELNNFKVDKIVTTDFNILDFEVSDSIIAFYPVAGKGLVKIYDFKNDKYLLEENFESEAHKVLSSLTMINRNLVTKSNNNNFTYITLDGLELTKIKNPIDNIEVEKISILDNYLEQEKIINSNEYINNPLKLISYLRKNDVIRDIFIQKNKLILITENGDFQLKSNGQMDNSKRKVVINFINLNDFLNENTIKIPHRFDDSFFISNNNNLFKIGRSENSDAYNMSVIK